MFSLSDFDNLFKKFRLEKLPGYITKNVDK